MFDVKEDECEIWLSEIGASLDRLVHSLMTDDIFYEKIREETAREILFMFSLRK